MKTAVVLGMRSGTSLMAHILHTWGVNMGDKFQQGDEANREGYFEDLPLYHLIKDMVGDRFERTDPVQYIGIWQLKDFKEALEARIQEYWGFKIPDAAYLIDLIDILVPEPHYIVCLRNIHDMAKSLGSVKHHIFPKGFDTTDYCIKYQDLMLDGVRGRNHIIFNYEDVLKYPVEELTQLKDFIGLNIPNSVFDQGVALIKPKLRHHAFNI